MLPFSSMGPKNTTSDSQKQPILRTWDCVQGYAREGRGVGIVPTVTALFLHLIFYCPRSAKNCLLCRRLALYLLHVRCFAVSAEQSVLSTPKWEKEKKTAHTDHSLKTEEPTKAQLSSEEAGEKKKIPPRLPHNKEMSIPVPDEQ